ncbi:MAG: rod shape-determining protein RodA [Candidatus Wildermuthbacteria bacterium]|nr:rod shape-determining protein RodA [Candidatus Wildermuthbacteria bacterium]
MGIQKFLRQIKSLDWIVAGSSLLLCGFGLLSLYSSSMSRGDFSNFAKQLTFLGIGIIAMFVISFIDWRILKNNPYLILAFYLVGVLALAGLFTPFVPEIRGVHGWYRIGGISVDPREYIRLVLVILMAKYFALRHAEAHRIRHTILSGLYFTLPTLLVFLQPDLGSVLILGSLWIATLLVAGAPIRYVGAILAIAIVIAAIGWVGFLHDYQKQRIISFVEPGLDPLGIGWSQLQSKIAIGNGGIFGQGVGQGTQTQYGFLSEPHTDFIFAAIAEEFGLLGVSILFALFLLLIVQILKIGTVVQNNFARLFTTGLAVLFVFQIFINIGMNLGLLPIVGLPLPLVSYGGSSLVMNFIALGILQSIKIHKIERLSDTP